MDKDRVNITEQLVHKVHANWTAEGIVTLKMCDSNVNVLDGLVNTRPTDSWDHLSCLASETPNPELHSSCQRFPYDERPIVRFASVVSTCPR